MISRPIPDSGPGRLRPFCRDDIPAVVALRPQAFRFSERPSVPHGRCLDRVGIEREFQDVLRLDQSR